MCICADFPGCEMSAFFNGHHNRVCMAAHIAMGRKTEQIEQYILVLCKAGSIKVILKAPELRRILFISIFLNPKSVIIKKFYMKFYNVIS